ncbi:uncharacterized protein JN550_011560 [Neoarthrinium moseri]|uniref:uncharacterized protein n=1 Tax=Neoarthrinium moseri TaxID=1658444 RepID=UPI001FDDF5BB|nr:uncharacterized protein JN550_011560 [Neoarthrinium moseri]KAI1860294.1 hypothetical protein JN550_011560 [Neoarthrinium moseri]
MPSLSSVVTHFFRPKPTFTEQDLPDLQGKIYIVTGSSTGTSCPGYYDDCKLSTTDNLIPDGYDSNINMPTNVEQVYVAARTERKGQQAIDNIKASVPFSKGSLVFLHFDLSDLLIVKAAAESFLAQEKRLHVLFDNAGVMSSPVKSVQGYELNLALNCIATFLFTKLLTPILVSSYGFELRAVEGVAVSTDNLDYHQPVGASMRYALSKSGVWALAIEHFRRFKGDGVLSVAINPGNFQPKPFRDQGSAMKFVCRLLGYPFTYGACTGLYAAFASDVTTADRYKYWVGPFGRIFPLRLDLHRATVPESEGRTGGTAKFWEWSEQQVKTYL